MLRLCTFLYPNAIPEAMLVFLTLFLPGDVACEDGVRDELRHLAIETLGHESVILALDETSFLKRGEHSAGVAHQYCGTTSKVENCQVGVFLAASRKGSREAHFWRGCESGQSGFHPKTRADLGKNAPPLRCKPIIIEQIGAQSHDGGGVGPTPAPITALTAKPGQVYPAASLINVARRCGATVVVINPDEEAQASSSFYRLQGPAGKVLPALLEAVWPET